MRVGGKIERGFRDGPGPDPRILPARPQSTARPLGGPGPFMLRLDLPSAVQLRYLAADDPGG